MVKLFQDQAATIVLVPNANMVSSICQVGKNKNPVGVNSVTTSIQYKTPNMGSTELDNDMFLWSIQTEGLCQGVKKVIGASYPRIPVFKSLTTHKYKDGWISITDGNIILSTQLKVRVGSSPPVLWKGTWLLVLLVLITVHLASISKYHSK